MLLRVLALGALTILGGYFVLVAAVFGLISVYQLLAEQLYLSAVVLVTVWLVFAGLEFLLARKTIRTFKRWRQQP